MDRQIIDYLPNVLRDVREFKALADSYQNEFTTLWDEVGALIEECFVADADIYGIGRLEKIVGIKPKASQTLEERKFALSIKLEQRPPYTLTELKRRLGSLCGQNSYTVEVDVATYHVKVRIELSAAQKYNEIETFLKNIMPANMELDLSLLYNQHSIFELFTHEQMESYTHYQLRNEENIS